MTRKSRRITELTDRITNLGRSLNWTRVERDMFQLRSRRYALRIERLARATAKLRQELTEQKRVNNQLSDHLMGAMGYTDAALKRLGVPARTDGLREPDEVTS